MQFLTVNLDKACGTVLAHGLKLPGYRLKKGQVLNQEMIEHLREAGLTSVTVAQLEHTDVAENTAAANLAAAVAGANIRAGRAFTGRCNLYAEADGLLILSPAAVDSINRVHESLTLATLKNAVRVRSGQMVATSKIIPYAVPQSALSQCLAVADNPDPVLTVHAFRSRRVALIQTKLPAAREALLDNMYGAIKNRIVSLGSTLKPDIRCAHEVQTIAAKLRIELAQGIDLLLVAGASAIVDRRDVIPAAIVAAGGEIEHFGMPVDPGNLLLLATLGSIPVIGLPSCARSPNFNGLDYVLERLCAGLTVNAEHLSTLGVGGLLQEIRERGQAREALPVQIKPRICALLLAAGMSRRMGEINKLLVPVQGRPMVRTVVDQLLASQVDDVLVVTGHQADEVKAALGATQLHYIHNPEFDQGLSASLATGLAALPAQCQAVLVCLADMPELDSEQINALIRAYDPAQGALICVPTFAGKRGNPVLWDRLYFEEMAQVRGDVGARHLIGEHAQNVVEVPMSDRGVLFDVDSPQALNQL